MSILSGFRKQKRYATDEKGRHQLISTWTHTDTVYDDEGKSLTEIIEELPAADKKVRQTATDDTSALYEILFSESADNVTKSEEARKSSGLRYNPGLGYVSLQKGEGTVGVDSENGQIEVYTEGQPHVLLRRYYEGGEGVRSEITLKSDDIELDGNNNTWDGTNTSLKTALANAGTKVLYGTSAPTSAQGEDGQLYVQLQIVEPYLDNFIVDYSDEDDIDTELDIENFQECNVNIKQYRMVSNVETLIYEFDEVLDFSYDLGEQYYVKDDEENFICKLTRDNRHSSPQNLLIAKQNAEDKLIMTITDAEITSDAIKNIYIKNDGEWLAEEQGVPSPTASDINKVLMATDEGEYGWEEVSTGSDNICVPPVIYDNGELKKMSVDNFPGLEKVFLTGEEYALLTTAEKEDLSKIYYISPYKYYDVFSDGKVIIRTYGTTYEWFYNGLILTESQPVLFIPQEYIQYTKNTPYQGSTAWSDASSSTSLGTMEMGLSGYVDRISAQTGNWGGATILNTPIYAKIVIGNGGSQGNSYSDPYDVDTPIEIYYGNKQYTDFDIPDPLPNVTSSDNGKVLKVVEGAWAAGADEGGSEAVYMTLEDYEDLTTAEKEDPTKIYFVIDEGTKVSPTLAADDGNVEASSYFNNGSDTRGFPWHAFDGSIDTGSSSKMTSWNPWGSTGTEWISYSFDQMHTFSKVRVYSSMWSNATFSGKYYIEGSNDGTNWTNIMLQGEYINISMTGQPDNSDIDILLDSSKKFSKIRLRIVDNVVEQFGNSKLFAVQEFEIYATDVVSTPKIYYKDVLYNPLIKELPNAVVADAGKALVVNSDGEWDKGDIREVPVIHLGDNDKILTVESGEASWSSPKKVTHLYDEIPISDPLYLLGTIDPSTSPLTIDMTQHATNYEELRSTDFAFVFIAGASNAISIPKQYNPVDNDFGTFTYNPSTGQLTVTMSGGYTTGTLVGVAYKKAIIQLSENAKITGQSGTIDCTDVPNADTLTVSDFGIVITHVTYPRTSNTGVDTVAPSISYNQTTKQLSWSVNAVSWDLLEVTGYVIVGNYGDPEYRLITNFVGATGSSDGYRGYVPSPTSSDKDKFLKGDGTWNPVYRELTQQEYDALPSSKNSDGIIYFITDNS